jgi:hypothetical protein
MGDSRRHRCYGAALRAGGPAASVLMSRAQTLPSPDPDRVRGATTCYRVADESASSSPSVSSAYHPIATKWRTY